jgi:hypothetical protein
MKDKIGLPDYKSAVIVVRDGTSRLTGISLFFSLPKTLQCKQKPHIEI